MTQLVITDTANRDLQDIAEYIAEASGSRAAAEGVLDKLYSRCVRLARLPGTLGSAGRTCGPTYAAFPKAAT